MIVNTFCITVPRKTTNTTRTLKEKSSLYFMTSHISNSSPDRDRIEFESVRATSFDRTVSKSEKTKDKKKKTLPSNQISEEVAR